MLKQKLLQLLQEITEDRILFNKLIGMKRYNIDLENIEIRFEMRPQLVGNFMCEKLHGGLISTVLEVTGGMLGWTRIIK